MERVPLCAPLCAAVLLAGGALCAPHFADITPLNAPSNMEQPLLDHQRALDAAPDGTEMVVGAVVCAHRLEEALAMLKMCLLFSPKTHLRFIVFTEDDLIARIVRELLGWQEYSEGLLQFEVRHVEFPERDGGMWLHMFLRCASQRLFFPSLLPHVDALLYLDTDVLLLSPVASLWKHFAEFNSSQIAALALHHTDPRHSWYHREAQHPFYGKTGINSGVMLMNLTRMRAFYEDSMPWEEYVAAVQAKWGPHSRWGDEAILNIVFHFHSAMLFVLDCDANFRTDLCDEGAFCPAAERRGARAVHGNRFVFHSSRPTGLDVLYAVARDYRLGTDPAVHFLWPLRERLRAAPASNCAKNAVVYTFIPAQLFSTKKLTVP